VQQQDRRTLAPAPPWIVVPAVAMSNWSNPSNMKPLPSS
jgi:hypothetical protein